MCKLDEILIRVRSLEEQLEEKGYHDAPKVIVAGGRDLMTTNDASETF